MSEPWIDIAARQLAVRDNRRAVLRALLGVLLSSVLHLAGGKRLSAAQSECGIHELPCSGGFGAIECVNPSSDATNCGGCGIVCPGDAWCSFGRCEGGPGDGDPQTCGVFEVLCPNQIGGYDCVDTSTDDENCGSCGLVCPGESRCFNGTCQCNLWEQLCLDPIGTAICTDVSGDEEHCGACGVVCPRSAMCIAGECDCGFGKSLCPDSFDDEGECVNTASDEEHCGGCGNRCGPDERCNDGQCTPSDEARSTATQVPAPERDDSVPFGVDSVTTISLTAERFEAALPEAFTDCVRITDAIQREITAPLYEQSRRSKSFFYRDPDGPENEVTAMANVSELRNGLSMRRFLRRLMRDCRDTPGCVTEQDNIATPSRVLFALSVFPADDTDHPGHKLVWGRRNGSLVYTFTTRSSQSLEELAEAFVEKATAIAESESSD